MEQKNYNTITLPELFWKVLSRWWIVVIFAVVGVLAMYKFKTVNYDAELDDYNKKKLNYDLQMADYHEQMEFYDEYRTAADRDEASKAAMADKLESFCRSRLNAEQLALVDNAMDTRQLIEDTTEFQQNAIMQKVDPYNIPTLYVVYQINPDVWDWIGSINQYYVNSNASNDFWEQLIDLMGWRGTLDCGLLSSCGSLGFITSNQFAITFSYTDMETLDRVQTALETIVENIRTQVIDSTGMTFTLAVAEESKYIRADGNVASSQNTYQQWNTGYYNQLNGIINTMSYVKPQLNLYYVLENRITGGNGYITVNNPTPPSELELGRAPLSKTLQLAIGCAIGIILGIVLILLMVTFGTRVQKAEGLENYCELNLLGVLISNRFILPFEKLIRTLKNKKLGSMDSEKRLDITADKLAAVCEKQELKQLVLSGTAAVKRNEALLKKLAEKLDAKGIKVRYTGNMLEDSKAFSEALNTCSVVFVEEEIRSRYERIEREKLMVAGCGIKVLGAVCII